MIIIADKKFVSAPFNNEEELEQVVINNAEYIFGPDSIMLPKSLIKSADGFGTIPDGYAIDFATRRWFIVEAELGSHSVWGHIAPQVSKQIVAAQQPSSRRLLVEAVINRIREDSILKERIDELGILEIDIRQVLIEIIESQPIVGIPIDHVSADLRDWAKTLKNEVKLWIVRKLVDLQNAETILYEIPDEFKPVFDSSDEQNQEQFGAFYEVGIADLIEAKKLQANQELYMSYQPRGGERQTYTAVIMPDGSLAVDGHIYSAPSYAALYCMKKAGSSRNSVNGWTSWRTSDDRLISDLREEILEQSQERNYAYYEIGIADLIAADKLQANQRLYLSYQPRGGERQIYEAILLPDGGPVVDGETYTTPSYAALYCMKQAGSSRTSVNGWTAWRTSDDRLISDLRDELLEQTT